MHIEIPDGILPFWLWVIPFVVLAISLGISIHFAKKDIKKMPLVALLSAFSLLAMSIPLGLPVHINLMILVGIIVGPAWSLIVSFVVNTILSFLGHGGITVIGVNTILLWIQALIGFYLFAFLVKKFSFNNVKKGILGSFVTIVSLLISFVLLTGVVYLINLNPKEIILEHHHHNGDTEHHENEVYESEHNENHGHDKEYEHQHHEDDEISLFSFILLALPIFLYASIIEALVSGFAISFISKAKPEIL